MGFKLLLNILYTIGIVVCLYIVYWGFINQRYAFVLGAGFIAAMLVILKIRLLKQVRSLQNNHNK